MVIIRNGQNEKLSQLPKPVKRAYSLGRNSGSACTLLNTVYLPGPNR